MKILTVILLALFANFAAKAQSIQEGQTCLFQCLHYVHPDTSVKTIIDSFNRYTGTDQDIYQDGAKATVQQTINFIATQVDTFDVRRIGVVKALQDHYRILTVIQLTDDNGNLYDHEIILMSLKATDPNDPATVRLLFYDPAFGKIREIKLIKWVKSNPHYVIPIKA
jgi:hypothetical protein